MRFEESQGCRLPGPGGHRRGPENQQKYETGKKKQTRRWTIGKKKLSVPISLTKVGWEALGKGTGKALKYIQTQATTRNGTSKKLETDKPLGN